MGTVLDNFCVAYTKCKATLCHHLIYLFLYLFVYESRVPVTWSSVWGELIVLVVSLGWSNLFQVIVSRVSYPRTSQRIACENRLPLLGWPSEEGRLCSQASQQTQTRLVLQVQIALELLRSYTG